MSKGLEALKRIGKQTTKDTSFGIDIETNCNKDYKIIEKELKRLAKIDDLLEEIDIDENDLPIWFEMQKQDGKKNKRLEELEKAFDALSKDDEKAKKLLSLEIEKNRAFEIIKDKQVNCYDIINSVDYKHYLVLMKNYDKSWLLTQEEYDFLKEELL